MSFKVWFEDVVFFVKALLGAAVGLAIFAAICCAVVVVAMFAFLAMVGV